MAQTRQHRVDDAVECVAPARLTWFRAVEVEIEGF